MRFTAYRSVDMRVGDDQSDEKYDISFFESFDDDYDDIIGSVSKNKIVIKEPRGEKHIWKVWSGKFMFKPNGEIDKNKSFISKLQINRSGKLLLEADLLPRIGFKLSSKSESDILRFALKGNDTITGSRFKDNLIGGGGDDIIIGGGGADRLSGGTGADRFVYNAVSDSKTGIKTRDTITDFERSEGDKIDLSKIDANPKRRGNQKLMFIGSRQFTGKAGEVRFSGGILEVDTNWDKKSDMQIVLSGVDRFRSSSLIL
jgi:Ca2+-binding RTX toxin-like protein